MKYYEALYNIQIQKTGAEHMFYPQGPARF
jgi:hypothetical protein